MFRTLAILCLVAAPAFGIWEMGLRVKFDPNILKIGEAGFLSLPQSKTAAFDKDWVEVAGATAVTGYESLITLCPSSTDVALCLMFDDIGHVAGAQYAFDPSKFSGQLFDWTVSGFSEWDVSVGDVTTTYKVLRLYFMSPEYLALDSTARSASYNTEYIVQGDELFVTSFNGEIYAIPASETKIKASGDFTKQACIPGMGDHYYYNMTTSLECTADKVLPWFPLTYNKQLIGVGFLVPGKYKLEKGKTNPFETPGSSEIKMILPTGSKCMAELGTNPGMITSHFYFIDKPYQISCLW